MSVVTKAIDRMMGRNGTMSMADFRDLCEMELGMVFSACEHTCLYKMLDNDNKEAIELDDILAYHKNQTGGVKKKGAKGRDNNSPKLSDDDALLPVCYAMILLKQLLGSCAMVPVKVVLRLVS